jgi:ferritin-like metal-binding protein YciE
MAIKSPAGNRSRGSNGRRESKSDENSTMSTVTSALSNAMGRVASALGIDVGFDSLRDLFVKELQDLYSAEQQLVAALPKMAKAARSTGLRDAFQSHLAETRGHVQRLEQVFKALKLRPESKTCKAMKGLISEGSEWMSEHATPGVMDAGLIAAAQRVEHYEIAGYGCVRTYAKLLGESAVAKLLQQTLDEEGAADKKLTQLAKRINVQADHGRANKTSRSTGRRKSTFARRRTTAK